MCRLFAYRGSPIPLSAWLYDAPHSLERQAYAPREMLRGRVNVDGTGIGWWPTDRARALRYRSERPPWSDPNLPRLAAGIAAPVQVGAVRSATPGIDFGPGHVQPFVHETAEGRALLGAHNGWIGGFRGPVGRSLLDTLPDDLWAELPAMNDAATLFLLAVHALRDTADLASAAAAALGRVVESCTRLGEPATLNFLIADRSQTVITRYSHATAQNSLYTSTREGGFLTASEPLDDEDWNPVPESSCVVMTDHSITVRPLPELGETTTHDGIESEAT